MTRTTFGNTLMTLFLTGLLLTLAWIGTAPHSHATPEQYLAPNSHQTCPPYTSYATLFEDGSLLCESAGAPVVLIWTPARGWRSAQR